MPSIPPRRPRARRRTFLPMRSVSPESLMYFQSPTVSRGRKLLAYSGAIAVGRVRCVRATIARTTSAPESNVSHLESDSLTRKVKSPKNHFCVIGVRLCERASGE